MRTLQGSTFIKLSVSGIFIGLIASFSLMGDQQRTSAGASGPTASHTSAPGEDNCTSCHLSYELNSGTGNVTITGVTENYFPGQQMQVRVTMSQEDGVIYGFQLTSINATGATVGTFSIPQGSTQMQILTGTVAGRTRKYVEHTVGGLIPTVFGSKSWDFTWTAPAQAAGQVNFYVAGNGSNSDGATSGDYIYLSSVTTQPGVSTAVTVTGRVLGPDGRAVRNAIVKLTDSGGNSATLLTNSFGFYTFQNVMSGFSYDLRATSKRYKFSPVQVFVAGDLTAADFIGVE